MRSFIQWCCKNVRREVVWCFDVCFYVADSDALLWSSHAFVKYAWFCALYTWSLRIPKEAAFPQGSPVSKARSTGPLCRLPVSAAQVTHSTVRAAWTPRGCSLGLPVSWTLVQHTSSPEQAPLINSGSGRTKQKQLSLIACSCSTSPHGFWLGVGGLCFFADLGSLTT